MEFNFVSRKRSINHKTFYDTVLREPQYFYPIIVVHFLSVNFVEVIPTANQAFVPNNWLGSQTTRMYRAVNKPTDANKIQASVIRVPVPEHKIKTLVIERHDAHVVISWLSWYQIGINIH